MTDLPEILADRPVTKLEDCATIEQWTDYGRQLFAAEKRISWAIADWWAFGEKSYGERAAMVAQGIFGRSFGALRNAGSTARAFPETSRQHDVSFTHHQELAPLARRDPGAAGAMLETAAEAGLSAQEVREAARVIRDPAPRQPAPPPDDDSLLSGFLHHWNRLPRRVRLAAAELIAEANGEEIDPA
jgi:hypothetical protein